MNKLPDTGQPWAEVHPHGKVFLRKYSSFSMIKVYRCVQEATSDVIPHLFEYYHFIAPLGDGGLMARLRAMGYPDNLYVAGLQEASFTDQTFIAVSQYGGPPLIAVAKRLKEAGQLDSLLTLTRSFGECLGSLHHAGVICGDTHQEQFVADDFFAVRRIDIHQSRVRMDIVSGHPVFGGSNESYFDDRRLTVYGFNIGVRNELLGPIGLARYLDKHVFSNDTATHQCRDGYLRGGGAAEAWESAIVAFNQTTTSD